MPAKLTIAEKKEILRLYCETDLSTNQIAQQYETSSSTILRLLQEMLTAEEYKEVVSQKQSRTKKQPRTTAAVKKKLEVSQLDLELAENQLDELEELDDESEAFTDQNQADDDFELISPEQIEVIDRMIGESIPEALIVADLVNELVDEDIIDDEYDEDDDEDDDEDETEAIAGFGDLPPSMDTTDFLSILPLALARLPDPCYIVVDKISEIVTRPLRDFKDLGKIPLEEMQTLTMPVFDNHKIARRFSNQSQKVIKFPAKLIGLTKNKLSQKGITSLLFDGQIYSLR
jgi:transposase-like protein